MERKQRSAYKAALAARQEEFNREIARVKLDARRLETAAKVALRLKGAAEAEVVKLRAENDDLRRRLLVYEDYGCATKQLDESEESEESDESEESEESDEEEKLDFREWCATKPARFRIKYKSKLHEIYRRETK